VRLVVVAKLVTVTPLDVVEHALETAGCNPKRRGDHIDSLCPSHDDRNPSLSADVGSDGRVLLYCHAGCEVGDILDAMKLSPANLFEAEKHNGHPEIMAEYDYCDEAGKLLYQVVRYWPKDFRQRRPEGSGWR
jgi:hypothetical protein